MIKSKYSNIFLEMRFSYDIKLGSFKFDDTEKIKDEITCIKFIDEIDPLSSVEFHLHKDSFWEFGDNLNVEFSDIQSHLLNANRTGFTKALFQNKIFDVVHL